MLSNYNYQTIKLKKFNKIIRLLSYHASTNNKTAKSCKHWQLYQQFLKHKKFVQFPSARNLVYYSRMFLFHKYCRQHNDNDATLSNNAFLNTNILLAIIYLLFSSQLIMLSPSHYSAPPAASWSSGKTPCSPVCHLHSYQTLERQFEPENNFVFKC